MFTIENQLLSISFYIGAAAVMIQLSGYFSVNIKQMKGMTLLSVLLWMVHFATLGAWGIALAHIPSLVRNAVGLNSHNYTRLANICFAALFALSSWTIFVFFTDMSLENFLAATSSSIVAVSLFLGTHKQIKLAYFSGGFLWLGVAILTGSIPMMINQAISQSVLLAGMFRLNRKEKKDAASTPSETFAGQVDKIETK